MNDVGEALVMVVVLAVLMVGVTALSNWATDRNCENAARDLGKPEWRVISGGRCVVRDGPTDEWKVLPK